MPWIRIQGVKRDDKGRIIAGKRDDKGRIIAGTATIVDTEYVKGKKQHSKQITREKLGRPLSLASNCRSGIFRSLEGGIVAYDADTDTKEVLDMDDPRLEGLIEETNLSVHTIFGDAYLFFEYTKKVGMTGILREVFPSEDDFQRCMAHLYHTTMKNGARDRCNLFIQKSFASYTVPRVLNTSLQSDTRYFELLGDDDIRMAFFRGFVEHMRKTNPNFGKCCYVDSTPLPNDIDDNPFNAFSAHGESGIQCRLILVADIETGMPVWFKVIPGNVLDVNTIKDITDDVKVSLEVEICEYVLDAGYASENLLKAYSLGEAEAHCIRIDSKGNKVTSVVIPEDPLLAESEQPFKKLVVKMPFRKGYGHLDMFESVKDLLNNGKYDFMRENHMYFGKRREVCLFGQRMYAYIYIDHNNSLSGYRDFIKEHPKEFEKMKDKEKTYRKYSSGFFVLLSNIREEPTELLDRYFGRCFIETIFKTAKEYLKLLPLKKWTPERIYGKMLNDMAATIIYLNMRKLLLGTKFSTTDVPAITQSLMCSLGKDGIVRIDPPNRQVKEVYKLFGIGIPNQFPLEDYMAKIKRIEEVTRREMEGFSDPRVKEVRIMGGCVCVEVFDPATLKGYQQFAYERGVFSRPFLKYLYAMVPYVITEDELVKVLSTMREWFRR